MKLKSFGIWAKISMVPAKLLYPFILAISVLGAYFIKMCLMQSC
jgi:putative tricarboxylic transport membrane protein